VIRCGSCQSPECGGHPRSAYIPCLGLLFTGSHPGLPQC